MLSNKTNVSSNVADSDLRAELEKEKNNTAYYYGLLMAVSSFGEVDKATKRAGVGKRFAGGTARGAAAPYPGQSSMASERVRKENADMSEPASGSGGRETA